MFKNQKVILKLLAVIMLVAIVVCSLPVSASSYWDVIPEMNNTYPYVIAERKGSFWGSGKFVGNERINAGWHQFGYLNTDGSVIDTTKAKYMEFDVWSNAETLNTMGFWLSCNVWQESGRALFTFPKLKKGWNHVVINLSAVSAYANFGAVSYDRTKIKCMFIDGTPATKENIELDFRFANWAFTTNIKTGYEKNDYATNTDNPDIVPKSNYKYNNVISVRDIDLKGEKNNTLDERYFVWQTYYDAFKDTINYPLDITKADFIEFDYFSDVDDKFYMALGSLHEANGFQFYDNRSMTKQVEVKAGWNHIVLSTDVEYRNIDTSSLKSYNPQKVTGFILHNVKAGYIRLTNVAITSKTTSSDPKLNYRDDFSWGAAFHSPNFGLSYRPDNIELQIKQLAEMGGKLMRVDSTEDFSYLDKAVKLCNAYGIKVMLIVYLPNRTFDPYAEIDFEAIKQHYRTYATRYDGKHGCGKIDYIQIDNELDVAIMHTTGIINSGYNISDYDQGALAAITHQVRAASEAIEESGTDAKRIINIGWIHFGIMKYFYLNGVEWDVSGHDWYQDMFGYGDDPEELYAAGEEYYKLFKKPIIICETNMWMNAHNGTTDYPDYGKSSWWNPFIQVLENYYEKDYVIGCTIYEFYDEPVHQSGDSWYGEAHFGLNKVNVDGSFKQHKVIYYRLKNMFGGKEIKQKTWHEIEDDYTVFGEYDMVNLISIKNEILENKGEYNGKMDFVVDGRVDALDLTKLKTYLFTIF